MHRVGKPQVSVSLNSKQPSGHRQSPCSTTENAAHVTVKALSIITSRYFPIFHVDDLPFILDKYIFLYLSEYIRIYFARNCNVDVICTRFLKFCHRLKIIWKLREIKRNPMNNSLHICPRNAMSRIGEEIKRKKEKK